MLANIQGASMDYQRLKHRHRTGREMITWTSACARDSVALMSKLVPTILTIMMDHPDSLWGDASYPVVDG